MGKNEVGTSGRFDKMGILDESRQGGDPMAGSVNKVILVGNLGRDPEIRSTQDGMRIANLSDRHLGELARPGVRASARSAPSGTAS